MPREGIGECVAEACDECIRSVMHFSQLSADSRGMHEAVEMSSLLNQIFNCETWVSPFVLCAVTWIVPPAIVKGARANFR